LAAEENCVDAVDVLLRAGANIEAKNQVGMVHVDDGVVAVAVAL
jgi:hypothetical protein